MLADGDHTRRAPNAPDFFGGWWGYSSKDLRDAARRGLRPAPAAASTAARGSRKRCRRALRGSLRQALEVDAAGSSTAAATATPTRRRDCFDRNRSTVASGIEIGSFPFQNRPTFQQTVSIRRRGPLSPGPRAQPRREGSLAPLSGTIGPRGGANRAPHAAGVPRHGPLLSFPAARGPVCLVPAAQLLEPRGLPSLRYESEGR